AQSDIHMATDAEKAQGVGDVYRNTRDSQRTADKESFKENPWAHGLGDVLGGVMTGRATGALGTGVKANAALGAVAGLGAGEGDVQDQAWSTAKGSMFGVG